MCDFLQETQEMIVFRLLDRVIAAELVMATIEYKVLLYVDRHKLNLDSLLLNYIKVKLILCVYMYIERLVYEV